MNLQFAPPIFKTLRTQEQTFSNSLVCPLAKSVHICHQIQLLCCIVFCFVLWVLLEQDVHWNEICPRNALSQPHVSRKHCRCWYWTHFFWAAAVLAIIKSRSSGWWDIATHVIGVYETSLGFLLVSRGWDTTGTFTNYFSAHSWLGHSANDTIKCFSLKLAFI